MRRSRPHRSIRLLQRVALAEGMDRDARQWAHMVKVADAKRILVEAALRLIVDVVFDGAHLLAPSKAAATAAGTTR